jgi:Ferritin-like domain
MATLETQQLDEIIVSTRRKMLTLGGAALAAAAFGGATKAQAQSTIADSDILNFALNLEYLEAQFYTLAVYGVTIDKLPTPIPISVNGGTGGTVTLKPSFAKVPFTIPTIASYAMETAIEEGKHVKFLQGALGTKAVSMPNIDLYNSFNTLGMGALGINFDPFAANGSVLTADQAFLIGAYIFEDVGVSAYHGAAGLIQDKVNILPAAVGIHAVEAYHAGLVRTSINALDAGTGALNGITQKISAFRSMLANPSGAPGKTFTGTTADDIGVTTTPVALNGSSASFTASTIVDCDVNSLGWSRTTSQVLAIVTGTSPTAATHQGVFFPAGLNGLIK